MRLSQEQHREVVYDSHDFIVTYFKRTDGQLDWTDGRERERDLRDADNLIRYYSLL